MSNRTTVFVSAIIAGVAGVALATFPNIAHAAGEAAPAAAECLSAPKNAAPAGAHWYYRTDRSTKRKCWYLADAGAKAKKAAPPAQDTSDAAEQDAPPPTQITPAPKPDVAKKPIQKSVANARAELTHGTDDDPALAETTWPPLTSADQSALQNDNQAAAVQPAPEPAQPQNGALASRWPDSVAVASANDQAAAAQESAPPAPALPAASPAPASANSAKPVAAAAPAAPEQPHAPAEAAETFSIRILLSVLVGILALAAIIGPMIFNYVRPRLRKDDRAPGQMRPIWDLNTSGGIIRQDNPPMSQFYADRLPQPRVLDDTADEIEELLAEASKRSAA